MIGHLGEPSKTRYSAHHHVVSAVFVLGLVELPPDIF